MPRPPQPPRMEVLLPPFLPKEHVKPRGLRDSRILGSPFDLVSIGFRISRVSYEDYSRVSR